jgi:hypothetical protein
MLGNQERCVLGYLATPGKPGTGDQIIGRPPDRWPLTA